MLKLFPCTVLLLLFFGLFFAGIVSVCSCGHLNTTCTNKVTLRMCQENNYIQFGEHGLRTELWLSFFLPHPPFLGIDFSKSRKLQWNLENLDSILKSGKNPENLKGVAAMSPWKHTAIQHTLSILFKWILNSCSASIQLECSCDTQQTTTVNQLLLFLFCTTLKNFLFVAMHILKSVFSDLNDTHTRHGDCPLICRICHAAAFVPLKKCLKCYTLPLK